MYLKKSILFYLITLLFVYIHCAPTIISTDPVVFTSITKNNNTKSNYSKNSNKPHDLFIGRCNLEDDILHQENVILNNDGKSQVNAAIKMTVEGPVNITCIKIFDEMRNGEGGYPEFVGFGDQRNSIEFNVYADYGKGFHFFVQIFGYSLENKKSS